MNAPPGVEIDANHIALIKALIMCQKPDSILELGVGSGKTTKAILEATEYNQKPVKYVCVDNFLDWGFKRPDWADSYPVPITVSSERDFIMGCKDSFDFIVSDADHDHSHEWLSQTFRLLNYGGIIVFHDITNPDYKNLWNIPDVAGKIGAQAMVFSKSSRENERCERGILIACCQ